MNRMKIVNRNVRLFQFLPSDAPSNYDPLPYSSPPPANQCNLAKFQPECSQGRKSGRAPSLQETPLRGEQVLHVRGNNGDAWPQRLVTPDTQLCFLRLLLLAIYVSASQRRTDSPSHRYASSSHHGSLGGPANPGAHPSMTRNQVLARASFFLLIRIHN